MFRIHLPSEVDKLRWMKHSKIRTKIIGTLGPASRSHRVFSRLLKEGLNIARLNFAHGNPKEHAENITLIRAAAKQAQVPIGLMQDLPGPKLRISLLSKPSLTLKSGDEVTLTSHRKKKFGKQIFIPYRHLSRDLKKGHDVFIADGLIRLHVKSVLSQDVRCRVANGGVVRSGNGVNFPHSNLSLSAFTKEDERHLRMGLKHQVDFVGISFVGKKEDVKRVRSFCRSKGANPFLIAKIERRQAIENLDDIIKEADGIMVARGDLGVEVPFSQIPGIQRNLVSKAHENGKPVIVATQVLESMTHHPRPTRAEATDIANAILEGADAIMLSGETSIGKYPVETVRALREVIYATENGKTQTPISFDASRYDLSDTMAHEICRMAERLGVDYIVVPTRTGGTASRVSRFRPSMPVLALVGERRLRRRFSLYHGIQTIPIKKPIQYQNAHRVVSRYLRKSKVAKKGQTVLLVSGAPGIKAGQTGMAQLVQL